MSIAIDTNELVRPLVRDDEAQYAAARRLIDKAAAADDTVLVVLCTLLETEWVLRSRHKLDKVSIAGAFTQLLESSDVEFEHQPTARPSCHEASFWRERRRGLIYSECLQTAPRSRH